MATSAAYSCPFCGSPSQTLKLYVGHLRVIHAKDPNFNIMCGVGGCREVFRAFSAFNSHIYRHHRTEVGVDQVGMDSPSVSDSLLEPALFQCESLEHETCDNAAMSESSSLAIPGDTEGRNHQSSLLCEHNQTISAAKMLLELREGHHVSQVAIADVVANTRLLCNQTIELLKARVLTAINTEGDVTENIELAFQSAFDPFRDIATNYLFEKFCMDHLGCLVSVYRIYACC